MFNDMVSFSVAMLEAIAEFMATPPIFYLVGMIMLAFVVKIIMLIIRPG